MPRLSLATYYRWVRGLWGGDAACEPYATPEDRSFIALLNRNPDDDVVRLVFADWLEERGRTVRAGLLRAQVDPTAWPEPAGAAEHRQAWLRTLPPLRGVRWIGFERGSVRAEAVGLAALEAVEARDDIDCTVTLVLPANELPSERFTTAIQCGMLRRVRSVTVTSPGAVTPTLLDWLASEHATGLKSLQIRAGGFDDSFARTLAGAASLAGLRRLEIDYPRLSGAGLAALAWGPYLTNLQAFALRHPYLRLSVAGAIGGPAFSQLTELTLDSVLPAQDAERATRLVSLPRLRVLNLPGNNLTGSVVTALANDEEAAPISTLDLSSNHIGDTGISALSRSRRFAELEWLNLRLAGIGDYGAFALAASPHLNRLRWLNLSSNSIQDDGFLSLCKWLAGNGVERLDLTNNPVASDPPSHPWWRLRNRVYL